MVTNVRPDGMLWTTWSIWSMWIRSVWIRSVWSRSVWNRSVLLDGGARHHPLARRVLVAVSRFPGDRER